MVFMDEEVKRVFTPGLMVSFRSLRKLSSYLVRAKVHPTERVIGSFKCNKPQCLVSINVTETNTLTSIVTGRKHSRNEDRM